MYKHVPEKRRRQSPLIPSSSFGALNYLNIPMVVLFSSISNSHKVEDLVIVHCISNEDIIVHVYKSSSSGKSSWGKAPIRVPGKSAEPAEGVTDSRKLIETASEPNPSNKSTVEGSGSREAESGASEEQTRKLKGKGKMTEQMSKLVVLADDELRAATVSEQPRRTRRGQPRKTIVYSEEELSDKAEGAVDSASGNCEKRMAPIWLTLIASNNQEGRAPLPQIPTLYLMIKG